MSGDPRGASPHPDTGSATLELAVIAPVLLMLLSLVIVAGRLAAAAGSVDQAAAAAARAASLARNARSAQAEAERIARASLRSQGVICAPLRTSIDTAGFRVEVGRPASISVAVRCSVPLADLAVAGMPGTRIVSAAATSPLDRYRGRG